MITPSQSIAAAEQLVSDAVSAIEREMDKVIVSSRTERYSSAFVSVKFYPACVLERLPELAAEYVRNGYPKAVYDTTQLSLVVYLV